MNVKKTASSQLFLEKSIAANKQYMMIEPTHKNSITRLVFSFTSLPLHPTARFWLVVYLNPLTLAQSVYRFQLSVHTSSPHL